MSTMECINAEGAPTNPTKSLCDPKVFNTAITRAQGLIVAVGNPYRLMEVEVKMDTSRHCWKEYIYNCLINETVLVPDGERHGLVKLKQYLENKGKTFPAQQKCSQTSYDDKTPQRSFHKQIPVSG